MKIDTLTVHTTKNIFLWKSAIFHSIKLPFDAEVAEKILNVIYCIRFNTFLSFIPNLSITPICATDKISTYKELDFNKLQSGAQRIELITF